MLAEAPPITMSQRETAVRLLARRPTDNRGAAELRNTPALAAGALTETDDEKVLPGSVPDAIDEIPEPCLLCPLCSCGFPCCRTAVTL